MLDQLWRGAAPRNEEQDKSNPPLEGWGLRKAVGRIMAAQSLSEPGWFLYPKGSRKPPCLIADLITSGGSQGPPDSPEHFSGLFWLAQASLLPAGRTSEISSVRHGQLPSGNRVPKDVLAGRNLQRNYWMTITPTKEESEYM